MRTIPVIALFLALLTNTLCGDSITDVGPKQAILVPATHIAHEAITECSGFAYTGGAFWTHNDSGDGPRLFRSETPDFNEAQVFNIPGAEAKDWEELAVLDGDILACDTGDNGRSRDHVTLYRVRYDAETKTVSRVATYSIKYPDGPHDCEGICVIDEKLFMFVKNRGEPTTDVFCCTNLTQEGGIMPVVTGHLDLPPGEQITAADIHGDTVMLLTYTHLYQYPKDTLSGAPAMSTLLAARQCEALCFKGEDIFFANEQRDVYEVDNFLARDYDSILPPLGKATLNVINEVPSLDGTGKAWANAGTEVQLQFMLKDEKLEWLIAGDSLMLHVRLHCEKEFKTTTGNNPGSGLFLMFGKERRFTLTTNDVQLIIGDNGSTGLTCWRRDAIGHEPTLTPIDGCQFKGGLKDGVFEFEAALPIKLLLGDKPPTTFLFDIFGLGLHAHDDVLFSGQNFSVMSTLPYLWGDVTTRP